MQHHPPGQIETLSHFFHHYLGRIVSVEGRRVDQTDIKAVRVLKGIRPQTVGQLRKMLGLLTWDRGYVKELSQKASCLYELLKADPYSAPFDGDINKTKTRPHCALKQTNHVDWSAPTCTWTADWLFALSNSTSFPLLHSAFHCAHWYFTTRLGGFTVQKTK